MAVEASTRACNNPLAFSDWRVLWSWWPNWVVNGNGATVDEVESLMWEIVSLLSIDDDDDDVFMFLQTQEMLFAGSLYAKKRAACI